MPARTQRPARGGLTAVAVATLACGPDVRPAADHDRVCGQEGPVQILALDGDRPVRSAQQAARTDDRRVIRVQFGDPAAELDEVVDDDTEVWSVGSCGESPIRLGEGHLGFVAFPETWPDQLLACDRDSGDVQALDAEGVRAPNLLFRLQDCRGFQTPHGIVTLAPTASGEGDLVLYPWPEDVWAQPPAPRVLVQSVRLHADPPHVVPNIYQVAYAAADVAFAITATDDLVSVELPDGQVTTEATGVRELAASPTGAFVGWRSNAPIGSDPHWPGGSVFVRERATGRTEHRTDESFVTITHALQDAELGVIRLQLGGVQSDPERFWHWPSMQTYDLPVGQHVLSRIAGGHYLVSDVFSGGSLWVLDLDTGELRVLHDGGGCYRHVAGEEGALDVLDVPCGDWDNLYRHEGELSRVFLDGQPRRLAPRATWGYRELSEGTIVTRLDVNEDDLGRLVAVDPDRHDEHTIDDDVGGQGVVVDPDDTIVYPVIDGDRTGVWITRLAP